MRGRKKSEDRSTIKTEVMTIRITKDQKHVLNKSKIIKRNIVNEVRRYLNSFLVK